MFNWLKPNASLQQAYKFYPILGARDSFALIGLFLGVLATSPIFLASDPMLAAGAIGVLVGVFLLTRSRIVEVFDDVELESRSDFVLPSDDVSGLAVEDGVLLGYTTDKDEPMVLSYTDFMRHSAVIGSSGSGKTVLGKLVMWQQMIKGGGFIMIDAKVDADEKDNLGYMARVCGRTTDMLVLNLDDPVNSNTYNPLLDGSPSERASRLLNLIPATENNPGSDHYRQLANHALSAIFGAIEEINARVTFDDMVTLMQSGTAMQSLVTQTPDGTEARKNLELFLDKYRKIDGRGNPTIDAVKLKAELGGIVGRMATFSSGKLGEIFNTCTPDIDLYDVIKNNKMLYIMLPTMGNATTALSFAKMVLSDLMSAIYKIQALQRSERPWPPYLLFFDEFGRYAIESSAVIIEQARSAQISTMLGFQGYGNLSDVSEGFSDMILQSTKTKMMFGFAASESAEKSAEIIGKMKRHIHTITDSETSSDGSQLLQYAPQATMGDGESDGESWREQEEYRVSIDKLMSIKVGQAIITVGGDVYHIRVPRIATPIDEEQKGEIRKPENVFTPYKQNKKMPRGMKELGIAKNYKSFLLENSDEAALIKRRIEIQDQKNKKKAEQEAQAAQNTGNQQGQGQKQGQNNNQKNRNNQKKGGNKNNQNKNQNQGGA